MEPLPVSVLLLARDVAARIGPLIRSLGFAREVVVVVDEASSDDTRALAEREGARVFVRALDGFGAQRRFALAQCREPWVLWIDADETLAPDAAARLAAAVAAPDAAGWRLERATWFLGRRIRWCGWRGERVLRLFRREAAAFDDQPVHETVRVEGTIRDLALRIEHHSYDTWRDCVDKMTRYAAAGTERARRAGRRATWLDVILRPPLRFLRMYVLQLGVLDGAHGLVLCALASAQVFLKYAGLWAGGRRHG